MQVRLDGLGADEEGGTRFLVRSSATDDQRQLELLGRETANTVLAPRGHRLARGGKLRTRPHRPGCRAQAVERLQGRAQMQARLARSPCAAEALAEAQLRSCALERCRCAFMPGARLLELSLVRVLVRQQPAATRGGGQGPHALGLFCLLLEIGKDLGSLGESPRSHVRLDQVGCLLNPVRFSHLVAPGQTGRLLELADRLVD